MDFLLTLFLLLLPLIAIVAAFVVAVKVLRKQRKQSELLNEVSCTISQITVNCDADGNVAVVTDDPSKVRVERRS